FAIKTVNWEEAIRTSQPDIVLIATPAFYHCDMAMFAMRCGAHVFTEKPLDLSLSKCYALDECQRQTGRVLGIGMQYRNIAVHRNVKRAIEQDLLGNNLMMQLTDIREVRPKIAMHDAQFGNGGPMVDMACHFFDLMGWYYQCDPVSINAQWRVNAINQPSLASIVHKSPDACFMTVLYENGSLGNIMMNWGLPQKANGGLFSFITGSKGFINRYSGSPDGTNQVVVEGGITKQISPSAEDEDDLINPERAVMKHFMDEIEGKGKVQTSIRQGIVCLAASMAAIRSSVIGRPVLLSEMMKKKPTVLDCMEKDDL
ncbi:MAG: hypothetical protein A2Y21_04880, partial [Clostridiales bacterium GWC2_40_7]